MEQTILRFVDTYGVPLALVVFFIYRDWRRERDLTSMIRNLEKEMRTTLTDLIKTTTKVIDENTLSFRELINELKDRPCLRTKEDNA